MIRAVIIGFSHMHVNEVALYITEQNAFELVGAADAYGGYLKTTAEISRSHTIYHPEMLPQERQEGTHGTRSM